MQAIFQYPGGKARLAKCIISLFPPPESYDTFIDCFGGAANVILALPDRPNLLKIYNDIDQELVNFFKVMRDPETRTKLVDMLKWTPYSRQQFRECLEMPTPEDPVERAWRFFTVIEQSFSGKTLATATPGRWGYGLSGSTKNAPYTWVSSIKALSFFGERLQLVQIENLDYADLISRYDGPTVLWYFDPPYMGATRGKDRLYGREMFTTEEHRRLAEILNSMKGMAVLSGYPSEEYLEWYDRQGWKRYEFDVICSMAGSGSVRGQKQARKTRRTECVWLNPACVRAREKAGHVQMSLF